MNLATVQLRQVQERLIHRSHMALAVKRHHAIRAQSKNGVQLGGTVVQLASALLDQLLQIDAVATQLSLYGFALRNVSLAGQDEGAITPPHLAGSDFCCVGGAIFAPVHGLQQFTLIARRTDVVSNLGSTEFGIPG